MITGVLSDLAEASARDNAETLPLFDTTHDNYLLLDTGWDGVQRIHYIIAHLRIFSGKIWVEADNTDREIVQQLLDAGIWRARLCWLYPHRSGPSRIAIA
ncbi:MAG: element excision factor XisI family protein [Kouleothrix sp.]